MRRLLYARAWRGALFAVVLMAVGTAFAREWGSKGYIQDGLIIHYDGIDNVGVGQHSSSTAKWRNLVTGSDTDCSTMSSCGDTWTDNAYKFGSNSSRFIFAPNGLGQTWTLQFVRSSHGNAMIDTGNDEIWWVWGSTMKFAWRSGTRPTLKSWTANQTITVSSQQSKFGVHQPSAGWTWVNESTSNSQGSWLCLGHGGDGDQTAAGTLNYCVRVYNRVLTDEEMTYNYRLDRYRFFGDTSAFVKVCPVSGVTYRGSLNTDTDIYKAYPIVSNVIEGVELVKDEDYTLSWENYKSVGTAKVIVKFLGDFAGLVVTNEYGISEPLPALAPSHGGTFQAGEAGVWYKKLNGTSGMYTSDWNPTKSDSEVLPGALTECHNLNGSYSYNGKSYSGNAGTHANRCTMYLQAGHNYNFAIEYDDYTLIYITPPGGTRFTWFYENTCGRRCNRTYTPTVSGWFTFDIRTYDGGGGWGPNNAPLNGNLCCGIAWNMDGPTYADNSNWQQWNRFLNNDTRTGVNRGEYLFTGVPLSYYDFLVDEIPLQILEYGKQAKPMPTVYAKSDTEGANPLTYKVDYDLSWDDNEEIGTGYVTITGLGDYAGLEQTVSFNISHSMYDAYDTVEYLQSYAGQRINTGKYFRGNHTFHVWWREGWMGYYTNPDKGWGCTWINGNNANWNKSIAGGGRKHNWNNYQMYYDNCQVYPYFRWGDRGMRPTSWAASVIPNTNYIFHETCKLDKKIRLRMENLSTGVIYETDPSIDCADGTNFCSVGTICLFGDYDDAQRGYKVIYGCKMVNDLTGETEWELTPAIRLKDKKPGMYDMKSNKFYTNIDSGEFTYGPITGQFSPSQKTYVMYDNQPIDPIALADGTCVHRQTGLELYAGTDFSYVISNNAAPGTARIYFKGLGNYEGRDGFCDFEIKDGGMSEKERYGRLSRAYVRNGLISLYDAIDNTGTGEHDTNATVWVDLSTYGYDATVGECSFWANTNALRTTTAPTTAGIIPVNPPVAASKLFGEYWTGRTIEMCCTRGNNDFTRMRLYENYNSDNYVTFTDVLDGHCIYWYAKEGGTTREVYFGHYWDEDQGTTTFTVQPDRRYVAFWVNGSRMNQNNMDWICSNNGYAYTFGGCKNTPARTFIGDMHCIRCYWRKLTSREVRYNLAIDKVRYQGMSLKNALPAALPDGYFYDPTNDFINVNVCLSALTAQGHLRVDDGELVKLTNVVVALGTELKVEYVPQDGEQLTKWFDLPGKDASYPDPANTNVLKLVAWGPLNVSAVSPVVKAEDTLPARTYVPNGLIGLWDGIDNLNTGRPVTGATRWEDLTGKAHPWYNYDSSYDKSNKGMSYWQGRCGLYYTQVFPDYRTIEMPVKMTAGSSDSRCGLYMSKNDYNRSIIGFLNLGGFAAQSINSYWPSSYCVTEFFRAAYDNTLTCILRTPASDNPCDEYYYVNGNGRGPTRSYYTDVSVTSWSYHYLCGADHSSQNYYTGTGILHGLRIYDREITHTEAAFNAAVDRVRFYGAAIADVFPYIAMPDGYRWNATDKRLEVRLTMGDATRGTLTPATGTVTWYPVGATVTVSFAPDFEERSFALKGVPTNATWNEEGTTATFPIACPTVVSAACEQTLPARTYVSDGLYNLWDGIDNVNKGDANHSDGSLKWHDLCQHSQYPWELYQGRAHFTANSLRCIESTYCNQSAVLYNLIRTFRTLEICTRPGGTYTNNYYRHILANRETRQQMHINTGTHTLCASYINTEVPSPAIQGTNIAGNVFATYAALWCPTNFEVTGYAIDGKLEEPNTLFDPAPYFWYQRTDQGAGTYNSPRRYPCLGARYGQGNQYFGDIHCIRCYDRPLTERELAFNAAVDRVRFEGAHPRDLFPTLTLPDGYRWNNDKEQLEVLVSCSISNGLGKVSLNGATAGKSASGYFPCGETVSFTAVPNDGRIVRDWHGIYGHTYEDDDYTTISFVAASPVKAVVETVPETSILPFSTYIQDGLVNVWDALEQPGDDKAWLDLKESTQMSLASGTLRWMGHAQRFNGQTYMSGYQPRLRQAVKDKSVTVQLFLRPQSFTFDSGYFSMGESQRYRALMLGMEGQQWYDCRAQTFSRHSAGGAFGMLFYCYDSTDNNTSQYYSPGDANFIVRNTDCYFGQDTLATITRDEEGIARLYLNDEEEAVLVNSYSSSGDPQSEFTCFGAWYGGRCSHYDLYAFRVYDRVLSADEIKLNYIVDRMRFLGDTAAVAEDSGYRYENGKLYAHLCAFADDATRGGVAFTNAAPAATAEAWGEVGQPITVSFAQNLGYVPLSWSNAPSSAVSSGAGNTITFTVACAVTNMWALSRAVSGYSDANFTSTHPLPVSGEDTCATVGNRTFYWFTNMTDETVYLYANQDLTIEAALVVGGGGAGGNYEAGGGGGGGVVQLKQPVFVPKGGALLYKIGKGGVSNTIRWWQRGGDGAITTFGVDGFGATGKCGSGGGSWDDRRPTESSNNLRGSSGGVASHDAWGTLLRDGWTFDSTQGWWGASGTGNGGGGGGGGGADGPGIYSSAGGNGGPGRLTFLRGKKEHFGSGGGGGGNSSTAGSGGAAEAGNGGAAQKDGTAAKQGYGGGGGGGGRDHYGKNGGSGCVLLSIRAGNTTTKPLTVTLASSNVVWTGSALTPGVTVKDWNGTALTAGTHYTLTWMNNTDPGRGYVRVNGTGTYAGLTAEAHFMIYKRFFASPSGSDSNTGLSWDSPKTLAGAITLAQDLTCVSVYTRPEVWCKAGTISSTSTITAGRRIAVRGGYKGASGTSDELADDPITWVVGDSNSCNEMLKDNANAEYGGDLPTVFQRFGAKQGKYRCVYRGGQTGHLDLLDCKFTERNSQQSFCGRGICLYGCAGYGDYYSKLRMKNCQIYGCVNPSWQQNTVRGGGAYLENWKSVEMDNCLFVTNGHPQELDLRAYYDYDRGSHIYAVNAPIVARNCEFRAASMGASYQSGSIILYGNCSPSAFTNCAFVGNNEHPRDWNGDMTWSGCIYVELTSGIQTLDLMNCTFAYNVYGTVYGSACLNIYSGTVNAKNCIFYNNTTSTDSGTGSDVQVRSGRGHFNIDWSMIGGRDTTYMNSTDGGTITIGNNCIVGENPLFVTDPGDVTNLLTSGKLTYPKTSIGRYSLYWKRDIATRDKIATIDVHLRTPEVGEGAVAYEDLSPAIDAADPDDDWSLEPGKNGKRRNLGAYGGSAEAEQTPDPGTVQCTAAISYNGNSEPIVNLKLFTLPKTVFNGNVTVECSLTKDGPVDRVRTLTVRSGETGITSMGIGYLAGTKYWLRITATVSGQQLGPWYVEGTAEGDLPCWMGHGGDSNKVIHVRADSVNSNADGTSWENAIPDLFAALSMLTSERSEIWVSGDFKTTTAHSKTFSYKAAVRGGFTGAEDDPSEREAGRRTTIDAQWSGSYVLDFSNGKELTLDGLAFTHGRDHGVRKTSSAGNLIVTNCGFCCNGAYGTWGESGNVFYYDWNGGGGANFIGTSAAELFVYDSDFSGNTTSSGNDFGTGGGAYIKVWKQVTIDHCNCDSNSTSRWRGGRSVGLSFYSCPVTMTRTRFRGNYVSAEDGSVCNFVSGCAGSTLRSCVFSGNQLANSTNVRGYRGCLDVSLSQLDDPITIENCTFAYNLVDPAYALGITKGAATVKNCIFFGNAKVSGRGHGADLHCGDSGSATVTRCLFGGGTSGDSALYWSATYPDNLSVDRDTCTFADPLFVSDTNAFMIATANATFPICASGKSFTSRAAGTALDVHLRSHGGTTLDSGTVRTYEDLASPAIDVCPVEEDILDEPYPNGSRRNLGGYGGTPDAAYTPTGSVAIEDAVSWKRDSEYTQPTVYFTLGGEGFYTAGAVISISTDGYNYTEVKEFTGLSKGETVSYDVPYSYTPGSTLYVKVVATANEKSYEKISTPKKIWGEMPFGYGKGGNASRVVHVRANATGKNTGDNWWDAVTSLDDAYTMLTYDRNEIWIAGDLPVTKNSAELTFKEAVTIRGGFRGDECSLDDRDAPDHCDGGSASFTTTFPNYTTLDGQDTYEIFKLKPSVKVKIDRLRFTRGNPRAVYHTGGGGDLTFESCRFDNNGWRYLNGDLYGRGMRGTGTTSTTLTFTNCVFAGNAMTNDIGNSATQAGRGMAACLYTYKRVIIDNCDFVSNGAPFRCNIGYSSPGRDNFYGAAIFDEGAPLTVRNTSFRANRATGRNSCGGIVYMQGASYNSGFTNCVWVGNEEVFGWYDRGGISDGSSGSGCIYVTWGAVANSLSLDHCTFAYNFCDNPYSPAALHVRKGTAYVRNCIFSGNMLGSQAKYKRDIVVNAAGCLDVDYTLFDAPFTERITAVSGAVTNIGPNLVTGDARFVTPISSVTNLIVQETSGAWLSYLNRTKTQFLADKFNAHLKSRTGYWDPGVGALMPYGGNPGPAIDASDPSYPYGNEPHPNGDRANLGAYGNTPYATRSRGGGRVIFRSR